MDDTTEWVYHEKQDSSLCGQHALNVLFQGPFFTAPDLAEIAQGIDAKERELMLSMGTDTTDALKFMAEDSGNVNESGFFSIEVLRTAIERFADDLKLLSAQSQEIADGGDLTDEQAFICNRHEHWFTIRKIGGIWFNLNSIADSPEIIRPFYLSAFLAQLQQDGYSVFVVRGAGLPPKGFHSDDDDIGGRGVGGTGGHWFNIMELQQKQSSPNKKPKKADGGASAATTSTGGDDYWANLTGGSSIGGGIGGGRTIGGSSRSGNGGGYTLGGASSASSSSSARGGGPQAEDGEDEDLARAIALSMQQS